MQRACRFCTFERTPLDKSVCGMCGEDLYFVHTYKPVSENYNQFTFTSPAAIGQPVHATMYHNAQTAMRTRRYMFNEAKMQEKGRLFG